MDKDLERFLSKVDQYESIEQCWLWQADKGWGEYGRFWYKGGKWTAHRWSYTHFFGEIPGRLDVDHICKIKACVNPYHLEAVTRSTNVLRGDMPNKIKTHCKRGHEFTAENTRIVEKVNGVTWRKCRKCEKRLY